MATARSVAKIKSALLRPSLTSKFFVIITPPSVLRGFYNQIDVDEFYDDKTHKIVNELFSKDKQLDQISFKFYNYYKTLEWIINGYNESLIDVIRINRAVKGMRWINQRPPTLALKNKIISPRKKINGNEMKNDGHLMHNLTMLFEK